MIEKKKESFPVKRYPFVCTFFCAYLRYIGLWLIQQPLTPVLTTLETVIHYCIHLFSWHLNTYVQS